MDINKIKTYQKAFKNFIFAFFTLLLFFNSNIALAQNTNVDTLRNWDLSSSDLKISAPLATEVETDQAFYLRYTQNTDSFYATKSINWKIVDSKNNEVYQRQVDSNQDKNDPVKIENPGNYDIQLSLKIDRNTILTSRKLKVIPEDAKYFEGLKIDRFVSHAKDQLKIQDLQPSTEKSEIQIYNNSETDLDISKVFFEIFRLDTPEPMLLPVSPDGNKVLPKKSYLTFSLPESVCGTGTETQQSNCKNINLVFLKNQNKNSTKENSFLIDKYEIQHTNTALNIAQINTVTHRTGGANLNILGIIPFIFIGLFYVLNLALDSNQNLNTLIYEFIIKLKLIYQKFYFDWIITFGLFK